MLQNIIYILHLNVFIGVRLCSLVFNCFDGIQKEQLISYFTLLYTQCLIACVCVCVCAGERKMLLLCSVMSADPVPSKKCLERLDDFRYSGVV
jgi:hypothetical protein